MSDCNPSNLNIIGVDVAKDKLDIYNPDTNQYQTVDNNERDIKTFITQQIKVSPNVLFVMEYTGGYEKLFAKLLARAACSFHMAHPNRIHYFAKQKGFFAKTDKIDAKIIAQYGKQEQVEPTKTLSKNAEQLKELSARRCQLIDLLTVEKCRLKPFLLKDIQRSIKRSIKSIEIEISLLDGKISEIISSDEKLLLKSKRLKTFKGIGVKTSNALICLLPELGNLNRAEIACLCGLAPRNKDSGQKTGRRMISGGRFHVRKAMYMVAVGASTNNPRMRDYYQKLKTAGKASKVALTAIMRKIIITLNAMLRDEKDWLSV